MLLACRGVAKLAVFDKQALRTGETRPSVKLEVEARRAARGANEVARRVTTGAPAVATAARLAAWARSGNSRKKRPNSASEIALVLSASSIWKGQRARRQLEVDTLSWFDLGLGP